MNKNVNEDLFIIDTSYNANDQLVLAYLITKLNVIAITVVGSSGERSPNEIKAKIEEDLKQINNGSDIPVYSGADRPYINYQSELKDDPIYNPYNYLDTDWTSTSNTINNSSDNKVIDPGHKVSNIAAVKIAELGRAHGKKLNIIATGPLTNLSLAVLVDSSLKNSINNLFIIGGSYNNLGNSGNCAEYNLRVDPVASKNTILYYKCITLLPLEIEAQVTNKEFSEKLSTNSGSSKFYQYFQIKISESEDGGHSFLGVFAALAIVNQSLIKTTIRKPCDIDVYGKYTRGALIIEKYEYLVSGKLNSTLR